MTRSRRFPLSWRLKKLKLKKRLLPTNNRGHMKTLLAAVSVLLMLNTIGCATRHPSAASEPTTQAAAPAASLTVEEQSDFYPSGPRTIPTAATHPKVDYASILHITVDPTQLMGNATTQSVLPKL